MEINEFNAYLNAGHRVQSGSDYHKMMVQLSDEARKITMKMNHQYQTAAELRELFAELT